MVQPVVQPVSGSGFYWVFTGFCGFLNIGFFTKSKPDFFWVTGFTGSTADPGRVSKHCDLVMKISQQLLRVPIIRSVNTTDFIERVTNTLRINGNELKGDQGS